MKNFKKMAICVALVGCMALDAKAIPTQITELNIGAFPSFGDGNVGTQVGLAITAYNLANPSATLPTSGIGSTPNIKVNTGDVAPSPYPSFGANTLSISIPAGSYNYIFLHWGGPNEDASYFNPQLFYIGGETGNLTFNAPVNTAANGGTGRYGLSFYSLYSPTTSVPDGGSTIALLGSALVGVGALRRKLLKA